MEAELMPRFHEGYSEWLDNVIQAFKELGVKRAHRSEIAEKVREIRVRKGLHLGKYEQWVQYTLQNYSRGKSWKDFFRPLKIGSGIWEYIVENGEE